MDEPSRVIWPLAETALDRGGSGVRGGHREDAGGWGGTRPQRGFWGGARGRQTPGLSPAQSLFAPDYTLGRVHARGSNINIPCRFCEQE